MPLQMRLSESDNRKYSPDRDLAYCTPHLIHRAMKGLDPDTQEPWVTAYLKEQNIDTDALVQGAEVLANYFNKALLDPQFKHPYEALESVGFFNLPQPVQTIICAKLGQVLISASFSSIRDVTRGPGEPSFDTKMIADVAEEFQSRLREPKWKRKLLKLGSK
jgi:hypothetical protein